MSNENTPDLRAAAEQAQKAFSLLIRDHGGTLALQAEDDRAAFVRKAAADLRAALAAPAAAPAIPKFAYDAMRERQQRAVDALLAAGWDYVGGEWVPLSPPFELQGGMDNADLAAAWARKVPTVVPTDDQLTAFALGVEVGNEGRKLYWLERNSARDAWRRRVKRCEQLEAALTRIAAFDEYEPAGPAAKTARDALAAPTA